MAPAMISLPTASGCKYWPLFAIRCAMRIPAIVNTQLAHRELPVPVRARLQSVHEWFEFLSHQGDLVEAISGKALTPT